MVVIGLGNELRGDDAVGFQVARCVRERVPPGIAVCEERGEPLRLLQTWEGYRVAILIDAMRSGAKPGTVTRLDMGGAPLELEVARCTSTHSVALPDAIELARELRRLPPQVVVYAIEGEDFAPGRSLSAPVRAALCAVARAVLDDCSAILAGVASDG